MSTKALTVLIAADELAFPNGGASSVYVRRLARAVALAGARAVVLCLDYSERSTPPLNTKASGEHQGVFFEYLTGDPVLPKTPWKIARGRWRSILSLGKALDAWKEDGSTICLYYGRFPSVLLRLHRLCAARNIPLVANVVEWRLAFANQTLKQRVADRVFHRWLPRLDGAIVISNFIELALREKLHARNPILRVPILADSGDWREVTPFVASRPYAVFCADLDAYVEDARFVIRALAQIPELDLRLIGNSQTHKSELLALAQTCGSASRVVLENRFIPDAALRSFYSGASVLLAPLHDDDRSKARFPSKMADYFLSGRPVVSSAIGDVALYFRDGENSFLYQADDLESFAAAIWRAISNPDREVVAARGRETALEHFSLETVGPRVVSWLRELLKSARAK